MTATAFDKMVGKTFLYNTREVTVRKVEHMEDDLFDVFLVGVTKPLRLTSSEIKSDLLPVQTGKTDAVAFIKAMNDNLPVKSLGETLAGVIEKLKDDPAYIDQARAINETAKSMIELGKLQVEIVRTARM